MATYIKLKDGTMVEIGKKSARFVVASDKADYGYEKGILKEHASNLRDEAKTLRSQAKGMSDEASFVSTVIALATIAKPAFSLGSTTRALFLKVQGSLRAENLKDAKAHMKALRAEVKALKVNFVVPKKLTAEIQTEMLRIIRDNDICREIVAKYNETEVAEVVTEVQEELAI